MPAGRSTFPLTLLAIGLLLAAPPAVADETPAPEEISPPGPGQRIDREILLELGRPPDEGDGFDWGWITDGRFRLKSKGLQFRRKFQAGDKSLIFKIEGPRVESGYGLTFEIQF